jgi:hypothetical protein
MALPVSAHARAPGRGDFPNYATFSSAAPKVMLGSHQPWISGLTALNRWRRLLPRPAQSRVAGFGAKKLFGLGGHDNPLIRLISDKEIQGNQSFFP